MCDDPKLSSTHACDLSFPSSSDLVPVAPPVRHAVLAHRSLQHEAIRQAISPIEPSGFTTAACYPDLTAEQVTQLSCENDVLIIGDHLLAWEYERLFTDVRCPVTMVDPSMVFHSYQGAARHMFRERGVTVLPAEDAQRVAQSFAALRARNWLKQSTMLMVCDPDDKHPMRGDVQARAASLHQLTGVKVVVIPVSRLQLMASQVTDSIARKVWEHWRETLISEVDEALSEAHLLDVARLYVGMRQLVDEHQANAIAVQEFEPFLFVKKAMPNIAATALRAEGITTAEEGDLTMLITQMLLASVNQQQAMMANVYLGYRDAWEANKTHGQYPPQAIAADYHQSVAQSTVMLCHFATAGNVPRSMTDDAKYRVVQTLPSWIGQSMTFAIPRLGDAMLARLDENTQELHVYPGTVTQTYDDPDGGWYRGRWLMKLQDINHFVDHAFSAHYAVTMNPSQPILATVCRLLGIDCCLHGS